MHNNNSNSEWMQEEQPIESLYKCILMLWIHVSFETNAALIF